MKTCDGCLREISETDLQCPYCLSKQVGTMLLRKSIQPEPQDSLKDTGRPVPRIRLSSDSRWASSVLDTLGDSQWEGTVIEEVKPLIEKRVSEGFRRPGIRWWWHALSSAIWCAGLSQLVLDSPNSAVLIWAFWSLSLSLHALYANNQFRKHEPKKQEIAERLNAVLLEEIRTRRTTYLEQQRKESEERQKKYAEETERVQKEIRAKRAVQVGIASELTYVPPPRPEPLGVSADGAERLCGYWMEHLGQTNVRVTRSQSDGGVDVESDSWVAQVKNYRGSVSVMEVRELVGVASLSGRIPVFFTSGTYTTSALEFANQARVLLFVYNAEQGTLSAANDFASAALD